MKPSSIGSSGPPRAPPPEPPERTRLGARERDVADATRVGVRRRLDAEPVPLGVAHHRPELGQLADLVRLRLEKPRAEPEQALELRLAVGYVDVQVDRQLQRRGFLTP